MIIKSTPFGSREGLSPWEAVMYKILFNKPHPNQPCCPKQGHILFRLLHEDSDAWSGREQNQTCRMGTGGAKRAALSKPGPLSPF